jgi:hypothetical protein
LILIQSLPNDISDYAFTLKNKNNHIAILSGFENQVNNTFDTRIQLLDRDGLEINRFEFTLDTVNTFPVDFEFYDNSVMIVGVASNEKTSYPSKPKRTFIMTHLDVFSNTSTVIQHEVKIYPNPTLDQINFSVEADKVEIFNVSGNLLVSKESISNIDVSALIEGLYIVLIYKGSNIYTKKFVKI